MAFSNIDQQQLGKFLQIAFSEGVRNQISTSHKDWEFVSRQKVADPMGREIRFMFQTDFGPSSIQYRNPNFSSNFPAGQETAVSENTAVFKELNATIELEYNLWKRAQLSGDKKYTEPLALQMEAKLIALKRQLSKDLYGDGTGVLGTVSSTTTPMALTNSNLNLTLKLSQADTARGHIGNFEYGEIIILQAAASGASALAVTGTLPTYYKVLERTRVAAGDSYVTLLPLDSSQVAITNLSAIGTQPAAGEVLYKFDQPTIANLSGSIADYGTITEVIPGLDSLTANDGRVCHGVTMSGATAGTRFDAGAVQIDASHIESLMNNVKIRAGEDSYKWRQALCAPEVYSQFINSKETDRRFTSVDDNERGSKFFAYIHREDTIKLQSSEYCPFTKMYVMPEAKSNKGRVIEYHGTDFTPVEVDGNSRFLKPSSSGGFQRKLTSFMEGYGTLINKHPAAVAVLKNFVIS